MSDSIALPLTRPPRSRAYLQRAGLLFGLAVYAAGIAGVWMFILGAVPDQVSVRLAGHTLHLQAIHHKIGSNALIMCVVLPLALWVELMASGWEQSSLRRLIEARTASSRTDLAVLALGQAHVLDLMAKVLLLGAAFISGAAVRAWLRAHTGLWIDPSGLPFMVQLPLYFAAYTFFDYWTHRLDHWKYFWPLHRYHHAAQEFCVVTSERQHPAQFVSVFVINLPLALLGADPAVMIYVNVIVSAIGLLIHSNIDSDWGLVGRWLIQSPNHDRLHHKLDMSRPTGHFAIAPIWDRLFGTYYGDEGLYHGGSPALPIGVDKAYRHGWWVLPDLIRDYWDFWRGWFVRGKAHL